MSSPYDSKSLFLAQVNDHSKQLVGLFDSEPGSPIEGPVIERSILSTSMLSSSASLLELDDWAAVLRSLLSLLTTYRDGRLPWDERLAQIISETIEVEDEVVAAVGANDEIDLTEIIPHDQMKAMLDELQEIKEIAVTYAQCGEQSQPGTDGTDPTSTAFWKPISEDRPLGKSAIELREQVLALVGEWDDAGWEQESPPDWIHAAAGRLVLIDFYAQSMYQMIDRAAGLQLADGNLDAVRIGTEDFAKVLCVGTNRRIDVHFVEDADSIDAGLFIPAAKILRCFIEDIFTRSEEPYLRIDVAVEERRGCLCWSVRDNGNNFITDSRLDPDEHLAFYPGLREVGRTLSQLGGLLWVEPDENHDTRFAFTTPLSISGGPYTFWEADGKLFAVRSSQVCEVVTTDEAGISSDERGDFLTRNGVRVPLLRLNQISPDAPESGDRVAIIGSLEKRVAIVVKGEGRIERGAWLPDAVPAWRDMDKGMAQIGELRMPLVEADRLLERYYGVFDEVVEKGASGGSESTDADTAQSEDRAAPSNAPLSGDPAAEILILERSEALRNAFASMLSRRSFRATMVDRVETALDCVRRGNPSLIISEFRIPAMGAKVLADELRSMGRQIPVLVTTTHQGESAEVLVERLGVAGYISKPLNEDEVIGRVSAFVEARTASAGG